MLTIAEKNENVRNTAKAPCGVRVHVPVGTVLGAWLKCEACCEFHKLIKTNSDGKPAKLQ